MKKYIFTVRGMACSMCESHVSDAVRRIASVKKVKSDRHKNETVVIADDLNTSTVISEIQKLGYDIEFTSQSLYKQNFFDRYKR